MWFVLKLQTFDLGFANKITSYLLHDALTLFADQVNRKRTRSSGVVYGVCCLQCQEFQSGTAWNLLHGIIPKCTSMYIIHFDKTVDTNSGVIYPADKQTWLSAQEVLNDLK